MDIRQLKLGKFAAITFFKRHRLAAASSDQHKGSLGYKLFFGSNCET